MGRFQVAVGAIIQHRDSGDVLLIHRSPSQYVGNIWEFPIGRTNQFETLRDGLKREVAEETGITELMVGMPFRAFEFMRGERSADNEVRGIVFAAQTGQRDITLSDEHDDYRWLSIDAAIALVENPGVKQDLIAYSDLSSTSATLAPNGNEA